MNLLDIVSTSPHYFCRKCIGAANENSNFNLRVKGLLHSLRGWRDQGMGVGFGVGALCSTLLRGRSAGSIPKQRQVTDSSRAAAQIPHGCFCSLRRKSN